MVSTSSVTVQSLGKIGQRAPAVGAKIWCLFGFCLFVCFLFCFPCSEVGALFVRGKHILNKQCVTVNFDTVLTVFSEGIALSDTLDSSHFHRQVAPQLRQIAAVMLVLVFGP